MDAIKPAFVSLAILISLIIATLVTKGEFIEDIPENLKNAVLASPLGWLLSGLAIALIVRAILNKPRQ